MGVWTPPGRQGHLRVPSMIDCSTRRCHATAAGRAPGAFAGGRSPPERLSRLTERKAFPQSNPMIGLVGCAAGLSSPGGLRVGP